MLHFLLETLISIPVIVLKHLSLPDTKLSKYFKFTNVFLLILKKPYPFTFSSISLSIIKEFKEFALRGNVIDLAVAVVIGGAFGKIVSSFVADVLMPPIGLLLGGVNFTDLVITLKKAQGDVAAVTLQYGNFIQAVVDFLIIALAIFMMIKAINLAKKKEEEAPAPPPEPTKEETLLTEIRDLLKK
jgi:large conductance mechanosensitive channel